jgi:hypothetical protein
MLLFAASLLPSTNARTNNIESVSPVGMDNLDVSGVSPTWPRQNNSVRHVDGDIVQSMCQ